MAIPRPVLNPAPLVKGQHLLWPLPSPVDPQCWVCWLAKTIARWPSLAQGCRTHLSTLPGHAWWPLTSHTWGSQATSQPHEQKPTVTIGPQSFFTPAKLRCEPSWVHRDHSTVNTHDVRLAVSWLSSSWDSDKDRGGFQRVRRGWKRDEIPHLLTE